MQYSCTVYVVRSIVSAEHACPATSQSFPELELEQRQSLISESRELQSSRAETRRREPRLWCDRFTRIYIIDRFVYSIDRKVGGARRTKSAARAPRPSLCAWHRGRSRSEHSSTSMRRMKTSWTGIRHPG